MTLFVRTPRTLNFIALTALSFILTISAQWSFAKPHPKTHNKTIKHVVDPDLKSNHVFKGADVSGKYKASPEGVVTVEADKLLNDLVAYRPNFKDRIKIMGEER